MAVSLITATIPNNDALSVDEVRFQWVFDVGGLTALDLQQIFGSFFNTVQPGAANKTADYLASCLTLGETPGQVSLRAYDITAHLDGSPHGSPYRGTTTNLDTIGGDSRGNQLCAVIGYHAADYFSTPVDGPVGAIPTPESAQDMGAPATHSGTTKLQSRKSGRMYLGPLDGSAIGVNGDANPVFTGTFQTDVVANVKGFLVAYPAWSVWSRRNAAVYPITNGWLDTSVMTRRHKGFNGHGRVLWP